MPPPQTTSSPSSQAPPNASTSSHNPPSSKDSEGYPSWLPKRPPPPPPHSTFQSSLFLDSTTPSPVEPPFVGGRKPTPRSVRIVSLEDSFVGAVEKETRFARDPNDQTRVGVHIPPKVLSRASGTLPTAFNPSEHDEFLPLPQPRFNTKNLHLQLLRNPSKWMRLYFYLWPLIVLYHIPLQSFFDFNAIYIMFQVSKYPSSQSSSKNWALGAAAYIACWLVWIFVICLIYELVYSFSRRWRLRRPLMLPIYLSSSAFNYVAMTSYTNFSFLQHVRFSAFFPEPPPTPHSPSDQDHDLDAYYDGSQSPWKSGIAETCFFYAQNLPTVAMLIPRAGLSMALLFAFSKPSPSPNLLVSSRDQTFFRSDGSLSGYARGVLFANAAWTGWRLLVLIASWLGLWIMSKQRLAGLCGPRHTWDESDQEKSRSIYSEAVSEQGPYRNSFYRGDGSGAGGDGALDYAGDELAWEWRRATRMRVQDAFEFCLTSGRGRTGTAGAADLRWSSVSSNAVYGAFGYKNQRYMDREHQRRRSAKGKEPSNEKSGTDEGFEGIEKVLAAVGFPNTGSPSRRGVLSEDLFAAPASFALPTEPQKQEYPVIEPLRYEEPGPSTGMFTGLEAPKMAKRNSKDKVPGSSTGAPLLNLPYPFSKPGSGQVSSNDLVLYPGIAKQASQKSQTSDSAKASKSGTSSASKSASGASESVAGSGDNEEDDDDDDDDEDDDDDDDEEDDEFDSEEPSDPASGSMSSLGHPISPSSRYPFGARRSGAGHARSPSGVSSGMSSGAGVSGGSHAHSHSVSSGTKSVMGVPGLSQSSESGVVEGRGSSHGNSPLSGSGIPMPPRHPHPQGQGRGRSGAQPSSTIASATAALAGVRPMHTVPVAFPTVNQERRRVDSGRGIMSDPALRYGSDIEGQHELNDDDLDELPDDDDDVIGDDDDARDEQEDRVGLLGVSSSPSSHSRISLSASQSSTSGSLEARSRTHSSFSIHSSRSRRSSARVARVRTHSTHGPSVRERASSLGTSMRSLMKSTTASMTQLDLIMRGGTGPSVGLGGGSRPRSRVNSSMARLEEDEVLSTTEAMLPPGVSSASAGGESRRVSDGSSGNGSHNGSAEGGAVSNLMAGRVEEGYSSSAGSHSRSGSEMSGENYTFGRPVLFMRPVQEQQDVDEGSEPSRSVVPTLSMTSESGGLGSVSDYSQPSIGSLGTVTTATRGATPVPVIPVHRSLSDTTPPSSDEHFSERQGLGVPWNHPQQQQQQQEEEGGLLVPVERWATTSMTGSRRTSDAFISGASESSATVVEGEDVGAADDGDGGRRDV